MPNRLSSAETQAVNEGFAAAFNGCCELSNPYCLADGPEAQLACFWLSGYEDWHKQQNQAQEPQDYKAHRESQDAILTQLRTRSVADVAKLIEVPLDRWPGNCMAVATSIVQALQWSDARAVYGLYLGPVSSRSMFAGRKGTIRHGWIVTREGVLVDPTAWVFDATAPALRVLLPGTVEHVERTPYYDEGMESLAEWSRRDFPDALPGETLYAVSDSKLLLALQKEVCLHWFRDMRHSNRKPPEGFSVRQLMWLARTPYSTWGATTAQAFYAFLDSLRFRAFVPVDYLARAERESAWAASKD